MNNPNIVTIQSAKDSLIKMLGTNDFLFIRTIVKDCLKDSDRIFRELEHAFVKNKLSDVQIYAHGLKAIGVLLGSQRFAQLSSQLEKTMDLDHEAKTMFVALKLEWQKITPVLEQLLLEIK